MQRLDFNRGWTVRKDGSEEVRRVDLPHDAMLYEERRKDSPASGACGYFTGGKYFYEKDLDVPEDWAGKHVLLECEGVYQNAVVLAGGRELNRHPYGYSNFYTDLSEVLVPGETCRITIVADNEKTPNSRWYSGSGVFREVALHVAGEEYILPEGIRVETLSAAQDPAVIQVSVKAEAREGAEFRAEILDQGTVAASGSGNPVTLTLDGAKLWDAEYPNCYRCRVELVRDGEVLDTAETVFGIRDIKWGADGLRVNGREVLLRGACIHHDNGILGACAFRDAEYRRVRILKEAGFNAIRSAHNPASKALLDACDRLGMYVMDETFDMWLIQKNPYDYGGDTFREWWKADTAAMIDKDYNHPSVILYSIGNEISDLGTGEGQQMCGEMAAFVREMDQSRPVTMGVNLMLASWSLRARACTATARTAKDKETGSQSMDSRPPAASSTC